MADDTATVTDTPPSHSRLMRVGRALVPIILLVLLVGIVIAFPPFQGVTAGEPLPDVAITHVTLPNDEQIVLHVVNSGAEPVTIHQILIEEAYWDFRVIQNGQQASTIPPAGSAQVVIPYHWTAGWDFEVALLIDNGVTFHHTIVAAQPTPGITLDLLLTLALIGILVGVIPVALGMLWFPAMERLSDTILHAVLAFSAGILAFLVFDAGFEAFEIAESVPGIYEGPLLVVLGILSAMIIVQAAMDWAETDQPTPLVLAYGIALGIGLHNLAEGLAIGSSLALGRISLGAFLIIGFMIHNVTEGPAIVAPVARGDRPSLSHFAALGVIAGAPAILGGWIGSFAFSPTLAALFLAIGVGALLQVIIDIGGLVRRNGQVASLPNLLGFGIGFVVMYVTDLLITI